MSGKIPSDGLHESPQHGAGNRPRHAAASVARLGVLALLVVMVLAAGCSSPDVTAQQSKDFKHKPLIWPSPPAPARIAFDFSLARPEDIGIKKGIFKKFVDVLVGADKRAMSSPTASP